jgi:hypothetical protein
MRDYGCDSRIDVRESLTWVEFRDEYVRQGRPVFITQPLAGGLPAGLTRWRRETLVAHYAEHRVEVGVIPYPAQYGIAKDGRYKNLANYLKEDMQQETQWAPGQSRDYVFDQGSADTIGRDELPAGGDMAFGFLNRTALTLTSFQWYLGPTGSGAPVHYHGHAFNYVAYGAKHWFLVPPGQVPEGLTARRRYWFQAPLLVNMFWVRSNDA